MGLRSKEIPWWTLSELALIRSFMYIHEDYTQAMQNGTKDPKRWQQQMQELKSRPLWRHYQCAMVACLKRK